MIFGYESPARVNFTLYQKRIEWLKAAGSSAEKTLLQYLTTGKIGKLPSSKCRQCKTILRWGDGRYNFDHRDNNPRNGSQKNCYLVCRNCHGKATKIDKRAITGLFGQVVGYQTIKKKVSYKKPKSSVTKKKITKRKRTKKKVAKKAPNKAASKTRKSSPVRKSRVKRRRK